MRQGLLPDMKRRPASADNLARFLLEHQSLLSREKVALVTLDELAECDHETSVQLKWWCLPQHL